MTTPDVLARLRSSLPVDPMPHDVVTVKALDLERILAEFPCQSCVMVEQMQQLAAKLDAAYTVANQLIDAKVSESRRG